MASSSLVTSIDSVMMSPDSKVLLLLGYCEKYELLIGLGNLKALLIVCLRKLGNDAYLMKSSLFVRIEDFIARLFLLEKKIPTEFVEEVYCLVKEVDGELSNCIDQSSLLSVEDILSIARTMLDNVATFHTLKGLTVKMNAWPIREGSCKAFHETKAFRMIDAFEVHTGFMENLLHFALKTGVELHGLLLQMQPIAVNAARVFVKHGDDTNHYEWWEGVGSNCSAVNVLATHPELYQSYAQALRASKSCFVPSSMVDDDILKNFLDSLISVLWDVLRHSGSRFKDQFRVVYERLRFFRTILKQRLASFDEKTRCQTGALICDAGVLICSLHEIGLARLSDLLQEFQLFQAQVELQTNHAKANKELSFGEFTNISDDSSEIHAPILGHQPLPRITPQVVGFQDDEVTSVLDRLIRGSKQLRVVPISGMAGIGKTTFALKLFNHPSVTHYFHARAWCPISQNFNKKIVMLQLLNQIHVHGSCINSDLSEDDIADKLRRSLKGKRYLILLDDVWTPHVLDNLRASFPDDSTASRIIVTSRLLDIAEQPSLLRLRTKDECLEILKVKLVHVEGWNHELGMKVAEVCKGLPLTTIIVAGLLATTKKEGWKRVIDNLNSGCVIGAESALELSFKHLPDYLQPCFLYFGAFAEDEEVSVRRMIRLWMAEGFVQVKELEKIEHVARKYLEELVERSLIMVVNQRSIGGAKTCRIHDLLLDFCRVKARQENLLHLLLQSHDQLSGFNEPCNLQRLAIYSDPVHFKESRLFCPQTRSLLLLSAGMSRRYSYLFDMSFITQIFELVEVLDIHRICLINGIPREIELLTRLRYLSIMSNMAVIPSTLGNLNNLETLIAVFPKHDITSSFPHTLRNLRKLKYLYIKIIGFALPTEDLENSSSLMDLDTLRGVLFYSDDGSVELERLMRKFPNISRLKCRIQSRACTVECQKFVVPEFLSQLESITICGGHRLKCEFGTTENLRKLNLEGLELCREEITVIGKLPKLEVLKLKRIHFPNNTLEMEEEEFPLLRILEFKSCHTLQRWTASDDQLLCLEKLVFRYCDKLKEIPCCLESSSTLVEIQVIYCSSTLNSLVRNIEEVHADFGNPIKVQIPLLKLEPLSSSKTN